MDTAMQFEPTNEDLKKVPKRSQFMTLDTTISSMSLYSFRQN